MSVHDKVGYDLMAQCLQRSEQNNIKFKFEKACNEDPDVQNISKNIIFEQNV